MTTEALQDERLQPDETSPLLRNASGAEEAGCTPSPEAEELSNVKLFTILCSIWIGVFLAALDSTVISTLLAPISTSFQSFATVGWITTSYLISQAALQPLAGKLTDIFGRRSGLLVSNTAFGIGTLMCGVATSEHVIIIGRVIAGAGGGGLTTLSSIVASDLVPLRKRGLYQGFGNIAYGTGAALGGLYGGVVSDWIGWRWAFLLQIPLIIVSALLVFIMVRIPVNSSEGGRLQRIDFRGSISLVAFLVLFLLALSNTHGEGPKRGEDINDTTGSFIGWPLGAASLVFLATFIVVEKRYAREPIMPLDILHDRTITGSLLSFMFMTMAMFGAYFYIPIYSMLTGSTATTAGLRLTPYAAGISLGSLTVGYIMNATGRYYYLGLLSLTSFIAGLTLLASFTFTTPTSLQILALSLFGIGYGAQLTVGLCALMASVKHSQQATTTSASYLFRATGGTIGAAIGSAVFQSRLQIELLERLGKSKEAKEIMRRVINDFDEVRKLAPEWRPRVEDAFMESLHAVFFTAMALGGAALVAMSFIREMPLHRRLADHK
ncbi:putative MFS multidrug transporter [Ascodesmis nigricans]|uniref:Putative MFS multidrug transporter n=1 Tax=Ascodesmis nigricans TaxID=341454 RepID=A0A4S2MQM3_9PEZI|nr:putative MFS multidrug transporter [Ascodesmis nigricans]